MRTRPLFLLVLGLAGLLAPGAPWAAPPVKTKVPVTVKVKASSSRPSSVRTQLALRSPGKTSKRGPARSRWAPVELFHVNRREAFKLRIADDRGRPIRGQDKRISRFLRCHHTNAQHRMDPRLIRLIYETGRHYPGRRIDVISGYRHPTVAKNPKSPHKQGLACDFRVEGISNTELRDYLRRAYKSVGVGYYPNSSFVHLDVRKGPSAFWIDYSGPNESAVYSENPTEDLRSGRADTWKPTRIDPSWAEDTAASDDQGEGASAEATAAAASPPTPSAPTAAGTPPVLETP